MKQQMKEVYKAENEFLEGNENINNFLKRHKEFVKKNLFKGIDKNALLNTYALKRFKFGSHIANGDLNDFKNFLYGLSNRTNRK